MIYRIGDQTPVIDASVFVAAERRRDRPGYAKGAFQRLVQCRDSR